MLVDEIEVFGVASLRQLIALFRHEPLPAEDEPEAGVERIGTEPVPRQLDLADVTGQAEAKWALEVAAAGRHHLLFHGPPGVGKTMLAERLPSLLPDLDVSDALEVSAIHSLAGIELGSGLITRPPYADPHHSASMPAVIGGGPRMAKPGAISKAHRGVLFLDEAPEFSSQVLEALRTPLESGVVFLHRSQFQTRYPARFQLVMAANPCPCGKAATPGADCRCPPMAVRRYAQRLSDPIRDRIDISQTFRPPRRSKVRAAVSGGETSARVAERVVEARAAPDAAVGGHGVALQRRGLRAVPAAPPATAGRLGCGRRGPGPRADQSTRSGQGVARGLDGRRSRRGRPTARRSCRGCARDAARGTVTGLAGGELMAELTDRAARMALSSVVDAGDPSLATLIAEVGAVEAWARVEDSALGEPVARRAAQIDHHQIAVLARHYKIRFVVPGDEEWPPGLDDLRFIAAIQRRAGVPVGLWLRGPAHLGQLCERAVAIVGSRASTAYGTQTAADLATDLAGEGVTVVSGGAYGIDTAAHQGALAGEGATVAVLANGVDIAYPKGNAPLLNAVARDHLVVSELPPGDSPTRVRFLARNRIIAAMSQGSVVVEAAQRSGARNTANWTIACGRHLMAVPGPVYSAMSAGPHQMVRDGQASLVTSGAEVLELVSGMGEFLISVPHGDARDTDSLDERALTVFEALPARTPAAVDDVALKAGFSVSVTLAELAGLERAGLAEGDQRGWRTSPPARARTPG